MSTGVELSEDALRKRLHEGVSKFASSKETGTKERAEFSRLCLIDRDREHYGPHSELAHAALRRIQLTFQCGQGMP
jgi:hypothetical protein